MANVQVSDRQTLPVKWGAVDVDGNPAPAPPGTSYSVVPSTAGTHVADPSDPSGLSSIFTPTDQPGNLGTVQLQISAPGAGSPAQPISGNLSVDVIASAAVSFSGTPGTPVSK
jgi:hypothetical protein